jgi:hypothetical protein
MGKKRLIRLQVHPYRYFLTGVITPVSLNLWGSAGVGSSHLFAAQREIASLMVSCQVDVAVVKECD